MIVHLVDGTYELFRHFYGLRRFTKGNDRPVRRGRRRAADGAADDRARARRTSASPPTTSSSRSATTCGPATRPARASSRRCWRSSIRSRTRSPRWASPSGRWSSSRPTTRWPRRRASPAPTTRGREGLHLDARQGPRAVRARRPRRAGRPARKTIRDAAGVRAKFGVRAGAHSRLPRARRRRRRRLSRASPASARSARRACSIATARSRRFPPQVLGDRRELALLFKKLATLRTDAPLFDHVDDAAVARPDRRLRRLGRSAPTRRACSSAV